MTGCCKCIKHTLRMGGGQCKTSILVLLLWAGITLTPATARGRAWLDSTGAYRDIVVGVHPGFLPSNCTTFLASLEDSISAFSDDLRGATLGQLRLGSVSIILPSRLLSLCGPLPVRPTTWRRWMDSDLRVIPGLDPTTQWSPLGSMGVGVHQPQGCGAQGSYISLSAHSLLQEASDSRRILGRSLLAAWARYRWGVFEERGYDRDPRYPRRYLDGDNKMKESGCEGPLPQQEEEKLNVTCCRIRDSCGNVTSHAMCPTNVQTNTSVLYRVDSENITSFCNSDNHDSLSPTPQNLLCEGKSVWEVIRSHPDFQKEENLVLTEKKEDESEIMEALLSGISNITETWKEEENVTFVKKNLTDFHISSNGNNATVTDTISSVVIGDSRRRRRSEKGAMDSKRRANKGKRIISSSTPDKGTLVRPTLVTSHLSEANSFPNKTDGGFSIRTRPTERPLAATTALVTTEAPVSHIQPTLDAPKIESNQRPEIVYVSVTSQSVVIALDLSEIKIEEVRGGLMRWLWGLGSHVKVAVIGAYNNASYPLTLGPLVKVPASLSEMKDFLTFLPTSEEAEDNVYGGEFCIECVMQEATWVAEQSSIDRESLLLVVAACDPFISQNSLREAARTKMVISTIALCDVRSHLFDQLAQNNLAWAVPLVPEIRKHFSSDKNLASVLSSIYAHSLALPNDPVAYLVAENRQVVSLGDLTHIGPYSTVRGTLEISHHDDTLLVVIMSHQPVKVITVSTVENRRIEVVKDTNQRFWTVAKTKEGTIHYTLKYLSSTLEFPLHIEAAVYVQKINSAGIHVSLYTNNDGNKPVHSPLSVWAEVTENGQPITGAEVVLSVNQLKRNASKTFTVRMVDDGSGEPDIRANDGTYSRYLVGFPEVGRYSITASLTRLYSTNPSSIYAGYSSERSYIASGMKSIVIEYISEEDVTPPSRITDLTVTPLANKTVNLTWSAPGGDLDQGSAWKYELKMYTESSALTESRFNSTGITVYCIREGRKATLPTPAVWGTTQHCFTELPFSNIRWFFAIRGIDSSNNTGKISNIVSAWVPEPPSSTLSTKSSPVVAQTVLMSTVTGGSIFDSESPTTSLHVGLSWRMYMIIGSVGFFALIAAAVACYCCIQKFRASKDPDRPIYKIYVNNAYIQEEDGEIKVVSNGQLVEDKDPGQVQEWVNSLGKYNGDAVEQTAVPTDTPLVECKPRSSVKYPAPVRFGVLTNGSIMREACGSSTSSSKPSDEVPNGDFKYRDMSETNSNATEGGTSGSTVPATEVPVIPYGETASTEKAVSEKYDKLNVANGEVANKCIPGPTVISIHASTNGYSSDEEGGFRPRKVGSPGPRRYLPSHFSSFRYLPPPPEYSIDKGTKPVEYTSSTIARTSGALQHGTVRSVKKRRHISFV